MRKTIQTILLVVGSVVVAQAQTIIPKVGITLSSTNAEFPDETGENVASISSNTGFTIGVGYNFPIATVGKSLLTLQPELSFIQKGFQAKTSGEIYAGEGYYEFTAKQKYKINFIELPVLARLEFGSDKARFAPYFGPSFALGLGGKVKGTMTISDGGEEYKEDMDGDIKFGDAPDDDESYDVYLDNRLDIGIQIGMGVTLFEKVALDLRYGIGLTNLSDEDDSANRVLQFTVGVPLRLK